MSLVLIVDDHRDTGRLLARLLRAEGFDAVAVESGPSALAFVRHATTSPALVLLDIMMPEMNGFETLEHLRCERAGATVPVVMVTAISDDEHRHRAAELGAAGYWVKATFDPANLGRMVRQHLESAS